MRSERHKMGRGRRPEVRRAGSKMVGPLLALLSLGLLVAPAITEAPTGELEVTMAIKEAQQVAQESEKKLEEPEGAAAPLLRPQRGVRAGDPASFGRAPRFALEPPPLVEYSNSSGALVGCRAAGESATTSTNQARPPDAPTRVTWRRLVRGPPVAATGSEDLEESDNREAWTAVEEAEVAAAGGGGAGSVHVRPDGSLRIEPFGGAQELGPTVHAATYRCCLANQHGRLCSRLVRTRPVVDAPIQLEVFDELALAGNSVALRCRPRGPAHQLARHLELTGWLRDGRQLVAAAATTTFSASTGRSRRLGEPTSGHQQHLAIGSGKYLMLASGELLVTNASRSDAGHYQCRARHKLTGQLATSQAPGGRLVVDESRSRVDLRLAGPTGLVVAREQERALICAQMQAFPVPRFTWLWEPPDGGGPRPLPADLQQQQQQPTTSACLVIPQVLARHAGRYICEASNGESSLRTSGRLLVSSQQLQAQLQLQVNGRWLSTGAAQQPPVAAASASQASHIVPFGASLQLNCSTWGQPYDTIAWLRDGRWLAAASVQQQPPRRANLPQGLRLTQAHLLTIDRFGLSQRGLYQCLVYTSSPAASGGGNSANQTSTDELGAHSEFLLGQLERDQLRSASAQLHLELQLQRPAIVQRPPREQNVQAGSRLQLECSASGLPLPRLLWMLDDQPLKPRPHGAHMANKEDEEEDEDEWPPLELEVGVPGEWPARQALEWLMWTSQEAEEPPLTILAGETGALPPLAAPDFLQAGAPSQQQQQRQLEELEWRLLRNSLLRAPLELAAGSRLQVSETRSQLAGQPLLTSHLNVSQLSPADSGHFKCLALSPLGAQLASAQINVIGSSAAIGLRASAANRLVLISGQPARLQCPLAGFPLASVEWLHRGRRLPLDHRQRVEPPVAGQGGRLELVRAEQKLDEGAYTCRLRAGRLQANGSLATHVVGDDEDGQQEAAQLEVEIRAAPQIDAQSLPELVQTNEGQRTKLVCSLTQGDQPLEIRWLRRRLAYEEDLVEEEQWRKRNPGSRWAQVGRSRLAGLELVQNREEGGDDAISVHNLEDSSLLTFKRTERHDAGDYLCLAQNEWARVGRWTRLVVNVAPQWLLEPPSQASGPLGARLQLDCSAHGQPQPQATWRRIQQSQQETLVSNYRQRIHPNGSLVIEQLEQADGGLYQCELANGIGGGLSKQVALQVQVAPHFRPSQALTQLGRLNSRAELRCQAEGDQPMVVGWRRHSQVIDLVKDARHRLVGERATGAQTFESILAIEQLQRNDSGQYVCVASNEFGTEEAAFQLVVQEPPEAPQLMRPVRAGSRQASVTFRPPYAGNSPIRRYELAYLQLGGGGAAPAEGADNQQQQQQANGSWQQVVLEAPPQPPIGVAELAEDSNATTTSLGHSQAQLVSLTLCCLQPFTRYALKARSLNDIGASEPSKPVQFVTDEEAIGGPPLDVGVEATGAHSLKVRWRPPARHLQNGLLRGYYIGYRSLSPPPTSTLDPTAASPAHLLQRLPAGVKVFEGGGSGDSQAAEQFQYKNVQLDLNPALFYPLARAGSPQEPEFLESASLGQPSTQAAAPEGGNQSSRVLTTYLTNLRRKTAYAVIVQAYNKVGAGPRSDQIVVSTLDAAPPMSPVVRVVSVAHQSALLTWTGRRFLSAAGETNGSSSRLAASGRLFAQPEEQQLEATNMLDEEDDDPQAYFTINFRSEASGGDPASGGDTGTNDWQQRRLPRRQAQPYVLAGLRCGSRHSLFMTATNSLGQSEPGEPVRFTTMGAAPVAPSNSRDFLQVNSTWMVLRLSAWHNAGCPIASFLLKYRPLNQLKWTILEHQLAPAQQTVSVAGAALFSARPHQQQELGASGGRQQQPQQQQQQQPPHDLVIRNLAPNLGYKLVAEASSEAGQTVAEYELDTANFSTATLSIHVNGLAASEARMNPADGGDGQADGELGSTDFGSHGSGGGGGSHRRSDQALTGARYTLGVWSLTILFVVASVFMASTALVLGFRSVMRAKPAAETGAQGGPGDQSSLLAALLCCSASSSGASSLGGADSSHSSSAGTCYQLPDHPMDAYGCALLRAGTVHAHAHEQQPAHLATPDRRHQMPPHELAAMEEQGPYHRHQLISSSSLSTIGAQLAAQQPTNQRHALTLGRHVAGGGGGGGSDAKTAANIRAQYAATLGKQHSSFLQQQQPIKYNHSVYGRHQHQQKEPSTYHTFQHHLGAMSSSSGYETGGASTKLEASEQPASSVYFQHQQQQQQQQQNELDLYHQMGLYGANNTMEGNLFERPVGATYLEPEFHYGQTGDERAPKVVAPSCAEHQLSSAAYGLIFGTQQQQQQQQLEIQKQSDHQMDELSHHQLQLLAGGSNGAIGGQLTGPDR